MKKEKGITLIALVITIIVLLILAGVAIATLTGHDSIIGNAENAVGKYNNQVEDEKVVLNTIEKYLQDYTNGTGGSTTPEEPEPPTPPDEDTPEVDENGLATGPTTITTDTENVQIVIPAGFAPAVLAEGNNPGQDGSVASIMPADQWNNITAEQINQGIVIVDHAITYNGGNATGTVPDFNEYVWVPIPESSSFDRTEWDGPYYDTAYHSTGKHPLKETSTADFFWEDKTTEYTNMVNSITTNKGFYIGRYEASNNGSNVAQSKRNQTTWTGVTQTTAITACTNNTTTNTHLMYGIEWDSALKWLIERATISSATAGQTKTMKIADIQRNSCSWGNHANSTGDAATGSHSKQTTGYSEYWKANNIYDLAGNVWEWTQEKYSTGSYRALRGGDCGSNGDGSSAAFRYSRYESSTDDNIRFPCQLLFVALSSGSDPYRTVMHQSLYMFMR